MYLTIVTAVKHNFIVSLLRWVSVPNQTHFFTTAILGNGGNKKATDWLIFKSKRTEGNFFLFFFMFPTWKELETVYTFKEQKNIVIEILSNFKTNPPLTIATFKWQIMLGRFQSFYEDLKKPQRRDKENEEKKTI